MTKNIAVKIYHGGDLSKRHDAFISHPMYNPEFMYHLFHVYFSSIFFITAEMRFYDAVTKISEIDNDSSEVYNDHAFWDVFLKDANLDLVYQLRDAGSEFLCELVNSDETLNIITSYQPIQYIIGSMAYKTIMLPDMIYYLFTVETN